MKELVPLHDLVRDHNYDLQGQDVFDPTGHTAYGANGEKIGTVRSALTDPDTGRLRYLLVDVGGWFSSKEVLVPVGLARIEDDNVYFDTLTREQVENLNAYSDNYDYDAQAGDERVFRGSDYAGDVGYQGGTAMAGTADTTDMTAARAYNYRDEDTSDTLFKSPERLRLLEERLLVNKERYRAGSVEVSKHVENRQQQVSVNLSHEEVVIERHPVTDPRPVEGNVTLGAGSETVRVDLEAERADVRKQAYVTEEVEIGKRQETETRTFNETVGREVLDVNQTGNVDVRGSDMTDDRVDRLDNIDNIDRDNNSR